MKAQRKKVTHMAASVRDDGAVSALCFNGQRPIDLTKATWTIREEAVTCPRCRKAMETAA